MRRQFYAGRGEEVPEGLDQGAPPRIYQLRSDTAPEADVKVRSMVGA